MFVADSMKPYKLKRPHIKNVLIRPWFLYKKTQIFWETKIKYLQVITVNERYLLASNNVAYKIVKSKKPHIVAEQLILSAVIDM